MPLTHASARLIRGAELWRSRQAWQNGALRLDAVGPLSCDDRLTGFAARVPTRVWRSTHFRNQGDTTLVAVKIRLKRMGKIRTPFYRIVVADSRTKRDGRVIEEIGTYNPKTDPSTINVVSERAQYWLGVGAQPTEAVAAILKLTGDIGGTATLQQPAAKADKAAAFEAALKELHTELPKAKPAKKKVEEPKAEEKKVEEPKAEEAPAEEPKVEEPKAEEAPAEEAVAETPAEEAVAEAPAEEAAADAPAAEEVPAEEAVAEAPSKEA
jgi:small subunit ribosomal protein S16